MKVTIQTFSFSKRQQFVLSVFILSVFLFISELYTISTTSLIVALSLSFITMTLLYLILRTEVKEHFFYPFFILPFLYTLAFTMFYPLVPPRFLSRVVVTVFYSFGLYSLFLSQNIFVVSAVRTINLLRSARVVSFILTLVVLFMFMNVIFSLHLQIPISSAIIFFIMFLLNIHSFWSYTLDKSRNRVMLYYSIFIALVIAELSIVLRIWPVNATIFSIFLTGIFYTYSGMFHAWLEKRLFRGVLWEYVWVGFLSILLLIFFARWGI